MAVRGGGGGGHWHYPSITDIVFYSLSQRLCGRILPNPRWHIPVEFGSMSSRKEFGSLYQTEMGSHSGWAISYVSRSK